ncbi:MAG: tol-pal system protein YbgF [Alphaproteobacteria bacterium]|nr:tol-pal system protein YbgF [Alphaproteobacteria bacterium]MBU6472653.1 tol-pal system protein YbgF [Alphaproteobacteria bacterium]MDE2014142.1 tol-pal system protein YbgF [Alphaproteobacteria bacterium]MDE2073703.1 tol-pal system protein YbgF [Alphaproteobacteria bacterium]MDE2352526.1 tol-pal system protein YbgF [Alphaproteobacteria bacterium]
MTFAGSFHRHLVLAFVAGLGGLAVAGPQGASAQPAHARYVQVADLFGPSDEEKAAAAQREATQDSTIANLTQRVHDLEESLRQLTGQLENANHRVDLLQKRIDRMQKDFDYRVCVLSAQKLSAATDGDQSALPCSPGGGSAGTAAAAPAAPATGQPSGVLGTLPEGTALPMPGNGAAAPAQSTSQTQYNAAMTLLAKAQYDEASSAFRSFADSYPKDDRAPQAIHWIGSIAYMQQDFSGAARAFAEEIKKYPTSPSAAEAMLKLGQSLIAMKQKKEGCTALEALPRTYPKASKTIREEASKAREASRCR